MPYEQKLFLLAVAVLAITLILYFAFRPRRWASDEALGDTADLDPGYRDGPTLCYGDDQSRSSFHPLPEPQDTFHRDELYSRPRFKDPTWKAEPRFGQPDKSLLITLTPRNLEHVNIQRRRSGRPPLSATGFKAAIAKQASSPAALHTSNDWLTYLILYEVLFADHQQSRLAVDQPIAIVPDAPFNGQGGTYAGAGATSSFGAASIKDETICYSTDPEGFVSNAVEGWQPGALDGSFGAALAGADPGPSEAYSPPQPAPEPPPTPTPPSAPDTSYSAPEPSYSPAPDSSGPSGGTD